MSSNPIILPANENERLKALKSYEILNSLGEEAFDRITELASLICDTPISLITLLDENRQWFKSKVGIEISETPRNIAFCQYTILQTEAFVVEDALKDDRFKENELVLSSPDIRFYAGFPLTDPSGYNLGTICVIDRKPRRLTKAQMRALYLLANEATQLIVERRQKQELKRFEHLFRYSPDLICITDESGYFTKVNPAMQALLGLNVSQVEENYLFELTHPDDREYVKTELERKQTPDDVLDFTARLRSVDGNYRNIRWIASREQGTQNLFAVGRDLTEDLLKERRMQESEDKLRAFFENSQTLMSTHDLEGRFMSVNTAGSEMTGYTIEELLQLSLFDLVAPTQHQGLRDYLHDVAQNRRVTGQVAIIGKNGQKKIWMFSNSLEQTVDGNGYVIANAVDITERYTMEINLQQTKKMLEETNQVARVGGWQLDLETRKLDWTSVTKEIHGVSADFIPDFETGIDFYKTGESREAITRAVNAAIIDGTPWNLDLQIVDLSGREVWVRTIGKAEQVNGTYKRLFGTFQDIDEKKRIQIEINESRAVLSAFVLHAPAAVAMLDKQMYYVAVSNCWLEDYGLAGTDIIGRSHYEIFPHIGEASRERHSRILNGAVEHNSEDPFLLSSDGATRYAAWEMRPWYQLDGNIGGIMIYTRDVTDIVLQRKELSLAREKAEEASIAKSEFLANMSHEIRTPLNGIIGFTDLALKTDLTDTQQQYLSIVNQSANVLLSTINDILDFSKIEAGKLELDIEQCDLYEICHQTTSIISYQIQQKGVEMLLNLPSGLPRFIWVDSVRLKQILINLLTNAAKFTEYGEIELKVVQINKIGNESTIQFSIRDTGIGIRPEKQAKIFEAFSQEDGSTTKKYGGTGLGLTISNKLLGMMKSKLELISTPHLGSTFLFNLKVRSRDGEAIQWHNLDRIKEVLIVDDNDNNREILAQMLKLKSIGTTQAKSGPEALMFLNKGIRFDLILMDYDMPQMSGLETIREIRKRFSETKEELAIILLSSSSDDESAINDSAALDVNYRLIKPVKPQDLFEAMSQLYQIKPSAAPHSATASILQSMPYPFTIMIAEDNPVNMLLAVTIVKRLLPNANILEANNGIELLKLCEVYMPDLVFMDMQMPEMNGLEATLKLRALEGALRHTPIIALTAGNVKEEKERSLSSGVDDFIVKPVIENTLEAVIKKWLINPIHKTHETSEDNDEPPLNFDRQLLSELVGGDQALMQEVLQLARKHLTHAGLELYIHIQEEDLDAIKSLGHKLYGTAASTALPIVAGIAKALESLEKFDTQHLSVLYDSYQQSVSMAIQEMGERN